ncbi:MAG: flagellar hook-length control protein FliK, partial [bacterium]|nr:flagellar hook-length control protein FliK [bacterium]
VVSPVVSTRPDVAVVDGSSVAARRGRRALPSEGTVQGAAPSTMLAVPSVVSTPSVPSAPPALVGGDVLGAPRLGAEVPPAESSSVVSPGVPVRPDAAVVDESSVAAFVARRGRRALPSEGAVQKAASPASSAPSAPSASSAPSAPPALPVSFAVPEVSAPAAAPTAAPVTAVEAVVAAFTPSVARAVEPAQVLVEAARAVADTLLVTPGLLRGEGEIRIQLRPDVLDGTEIHIVVAGRQLTVAFTPPTPDLVALIEQSRPQLTAHLAERIHSFQIAVDVRRRVRSEERG